MARDENPPFARGETFGTTDTAEGTELEGKEWVFEDRSPNSLTARSNKYCRCRIVRNTSGISMLPKRIARFELTAGDYGAQADGYTTTTAAEGYPIDEYLPSAGVAANDLFWIVVDGPAVVLTSLADLTANLVAGDWVVAITAATSQATTAGRVTNIDLTGATSPLALQVMNRIGRCLSAKTTQNTNADLLVEVGKW
jgi:hypothetical protein